MKKLRVAALSQWHVHADDYVRNIRELDNAEMVALWDEDPARGRAWGEKTKLPFEPDLTKLLARSDIDAVMITTPTNMHRDVMIAAASAGKHIFTEKVLAIRLEDARAIAKAVKEHNVCFCISFPRQTIAPLRMAKQMIESGEIGQPGLLRIRVAHDGSLRNWLPAHFYDENACGGGAMIDLGAHGMYLSAWLLGQPVRVTSLFNSLTNRTVEDNCVSVIEFASGAIAINETSFVSGGGAYSVELDGTQGSMRMTDPRQPVMVRSTQRGDIRQWAAAELPDARPSPIVQWIDAIAAGRTSPDEFGLEPAIGLTALMEAAYKAHRERRTVSMSEIY